MDRMFTSAAPGEHPFAYFPPNGGLAGCFHSLGCIGDSLSAGEFVTREEDGTLCYVDHYEHAWGAYFSALCGTEVKIFARGGMTAREFNASFAAESGFYAPQNRCEAYVIALGVNDLYHANAPIGTASSTDDGSFSAELQKIIFAIRAFDPKIHVFLMTMPRDHRSEAAPHCGKQHAVLLRELTQKFPKTHLLDFHAYAPLYDEAFREAYFLNGHMNAAGYRLTAQMIAAYIDFVMRQTSAEFDEIVHRNAP